MDTFMDLETLLVQADSDELDIAPPLHQSVPFSAATAQEFAILSNQPHTERFYRRYGHPTQARLEKVMAAIEGAQAGLATASGMGAISTTFLALLHRDDHVVAQHSMYAGTLALLRGLAPRLGIQVTLVDQRDPAAFERAMQPNTKLVMLESPSKS